MKYDEQDLDEFINVLESYHPTIQDMAKEFPRDKDTMSIIIQLKPKEYKFSTLLFPPHRANFLDLNSSDQTREEIYNRINRKLSYFDITHIFRHDSIAPVQLQIWLKKNDSKLPVSIMDEKKGGKKKRSRKRRKSTKKKKHIKKRRYTKKRDIQKKGDKYNKIN
uniref:Uncharacterized protein n=1 Tax=viral metagenome TaxID=1070528 RepID=A0A6C0KPI9_9ZZZZ